MSSELSPMNPTTATTSDPKDARLDALLSRPTVRARDDFASAVFARLREEDTAPAGADDIAWTPEDERLDALLAATPVAASADFTARTLEQIRRERKAAPSPGRLLRFPARLPRWMPAVSAFAALLTLTVLAPFQGKLPQPAGTGFAAATPLSEEALLLEWELLALTDNLDGTEALLDEQTLLVLSLLTE